MDSERARKIVEVWSAGNSEGGEAGDNKAVSRYLREELVALLSDSAEVGVGIEGEWPTVLALEEERFIRMKAFERGEGPPTVETRTVPLAPGMNLSVTTRLEAVTN